MKHNNVIIYLSVLKEANKAGVNLEVYKNKELIKKKLENIKPQSPNKMFASELNSALSTIDIEENDRVTIYCVKSISDCGNKAILETYSTNGELWKQIVEKLKICRLRPLFEYKSLLSDTINTELRDFLMD